MKDKIIQILVQNNDLWGLGESGKTYILRYKKTEIPKKNGKIEIKEERWWMLLIDSPLNNKEIKK